MTLAEARTARRRTEWTMVAASSFVEAETKARAYRCAAISARQLNAAEALREPFHGKD